MDVLPRTGLVLEPARHSKVNMGIARGDNGVLFRMVDVTNGDKPIPLGDMVVTWDKLDGLIEKLQEFRAANLPRRYFLDLDPGMFRGFKG